MLSLNDTTQLCVQFSPTVNPVDKEELLQQQQRQRRQQQRQRQRQR